MNGDGLVRPLANVLVRDVTALAIQEDRVHAFLAKIAELAAKVPPERRIRAVDLRADYLLAICGFYHDAGGMNDRSGLLLAAHLIQLLQRS